jgi:hypothetical protein
MRDDEVVRILQEESEGSYMAMKLMKKKKFCQDLSCKAI